MESDQHRELLQIPDIGLATEMAYAEAGVLAAAAIANSESDATDDINRRRDEAGIAAGRAYLRSLELILDQHEDMVTPPRYVGHDDLTEFALEIGASKNLAGRARSVLAWAAHKEKIALRLEAPDDWSNSRFCLDDLISVFPEILQQTRSPRAGIDGPSADKVHRLFGTGMGTFNFICAFVDKHTPKEEE